tara:strand:+ start:635 stop:3313 length:2679 start_codon:yes stop_codon:yes gene_type:complete
MLDPQMKEKEEISSEELEEAGETQEQKDEQQIEDPLPEIDEPREDPFAALALPPMGSDDEFDELGEDSEEEAEEAEGNHHAFDQKDYSALGNAGGIEEFARPLPSLSAAPSSKGEELLSAFLGNEEDPFGGGEFESGFEAGDQFNDPSVVQLEQEPQLGGGGYGSEGFGRATSPRLYSQASQFPACHQLRVWRWENGVPVGLGVIDAMATEEDFVEEFYNAMPRRGEKKGQFKIRPIDLNGREMGQEKTLFISEHHASLQKLRRVQEEERALGGLGSEYELVDEGATVASEMTRMFDRMMVAADRKNEVLERSLEDERERMRERDSERAEERVALATNAAQGVQVLTERMLSDESNRAERALRMQNEQSQLLLTTLTSVFSQQQTMMSHQSDIQRKSDEHRIEQERVRAERDRSEMEMKRQQERLEYEDRLRREQQQLEARFKEVEETRRYEREQLISERRREKEDYDRKQTAEKEDYVRRLKDEEGRYERDRNYNETKVERERQDFLARLERDRNEMLLKMKTDQLQWDRRMQMEREERERRDNRDALERVDRENRGKEDLSIRLKQLESQSGKDREHSERMLQMAMLEREQQRESGERRERQERELREIKDREQQRQHQIMMKEMELSRERDREHAERMLSMSRLQGEHQGWSSLIPKAKGLLQDIGLEPMDVVGRLFAPPMSAEASSGWLDNLPKVMGVASELLKSGMGRGQQPRRGALPGQQNMLPPDYARQQMMLQQMRQQQMQQQVPVGQPQPMPEEMMGAAQSHPIPSVGAPTHAEGPSTMKVALSAGLGMKAQRNARKALRALVRKMTASAQEQWVELITQAIVNEVSIYHYIKAVTVYRAVLEAGADPHFAVQIIGAMKESGMVPEDVPYGDGTDLITNEETR